MARQASGGGWDLTVHDIAIGSRKRPPEDRQTSHCASTGIDAGCWELPFEGEALVCAEKENGTQQHHTETEGEDCRGHR